jgi:hypothetical protein
LIVFISTGGGRSISAIAFPILRRASFAAVVAGDA